MLIDTERHYASVFFSQQAAEKALKALYLYQRRELARTHNLVELAKDLGAPPEVVEAAQELTPDYLVTRYPNAANGVPAHMYNLGTAQIHFGCAETVMKWTQKLLPS
ncbi:MAG: HEPN domain-containing protein [Anaerolineae bacterium]